MFNAVIAGNLTKDAETRNAGQSTVTGFSVAINQRGKDGKVTTYVDCSLWGKRGETIAQYLTKGKTVTVAGELTTRQHEGKTYLQINVSDVDMHGGGERQERQQDHGAGAGGRPGGGYDMGGDDIPFSACVLA